MHNVFNIKFGCKFMNSDIRFVFVDLPTMYSDRKMDRTCFRPVLNVRRGINLIL
jgi:hypothetical protein